MRGSLVKPALAVAAVVLLGLLGCGQPPRSLEDAGVCTDDGGCVSDGGSGACSANADCLSGWYCDLASGACRETPVQGQDGGADAGGPACSPACAQNQYCDLASATPTCVLKCTLGSCVSGRTCNLLSGLCESPKACVAQNPQPDICAAGEWCDQGQCTDVPPATCPAFTSGAHAPVWDLSKLGAVIYGVSKGQLGFFKPDSMLAGLFSCPGSTLSAPMERVRVQVSAYARRGANSFPPAVSDGVVYVTTNLHYVKVDGSEGGVGGSSGNAIQSYLTSNSGRNVSFYLHFCLPPGTNTFSLGLHFQDGNEYCATVVHD